MTLEIALVLGILLIALVFFVTEWLRMDVVALLVMCTLAIIGLVSPQEALAGFSNPAVITVWAVFILSGGLERTGVAKLMGQQILRMAGHTEVRMIVVIMFSAGIMSAFMNNVGVAALLLPVVMDMARQTGHPPSRLLIPLAYGCLLGGLTTLIGTPPNILVSDSLRDAGLEPFRLFDYTPVGAFLLVGGVIFMAFVGRHLLPRVDVAKESGRRDRPDFTRPSDLESRMIVLRIPEGGVLGGRTLAESRIGSALGLNVGAVLREGKNLPAPRAATVLHAGDGLLVQGELVRTKELEGWQELVVEEDREEALRLLSEKSVLAEFRVPEASSLVGRTLQEVAFRRLFGVNVLAIRRGKRIIHSHLRATPFEAGDVILVQGLEENLEKMREREPFRAEPERPVREVLDFYSLFDWIFFLRVPADSPLSGRTLQGTRLGDALGLKVLCIVRGGEEFPLPERDVPIRSGDRLLVAGDAESLKVLEGLQELEVEKEMQPEVSKLESESVGLVEAILAPRSQLAGKTLAELHFREKYGLSVLAVWRQGEAILTELRRVPLQFGDALLLHGPRERLRLLGSEPDFMVLTEEAQEPLRLDKAPLAGILMAATLLPVILGILPIYIAGVAGATFMVLTGCLRMEEAYRQIEWPAVFLIAGMLPLGTAMTETGAASYLAEGVVSALGPLGMVATLSGLYLLTTIATFVVPTAALVVVMAPIVLGTAADMGMSPQAAMMAIAMAASASLTSPVSHPANLLVMGPGGYRFMDYVKVGVPLTLVIFLLVLLVLPFFWPLQA